MAITKPSLSSLVSGQLPEFIREDYQTFVAFLEAYYAFLESQLITDFNTVADIDTTLDSFVQYFKNELALNFPALQIDDRLLLPKIKQLYVSKGSEASIKLLMKLLYNKDINVAYPSQQMLRVSDGKWVQNTSFFVKLSSGNINDIVGKTVTVISTTDPSAARIKLLIDNVLPTPDSNIFELFLLKTYTGKFNVGDLVTYSTVSANVIATTSTISVLQPGTNFIVGQTYEISGSTSKKSIIKIESIDINGGIKTAKFITFGYGYPSTFNINILATSKLTQTVQDYFTFTGTSPSYTATIKDSINQFTESGTIIVYDYTVDSTYVDATYAGAIKGTFVSTTTAGNTIVNQSDYAILSIQLGSIAKYPGYYTNIDGFLDDAMYIQDSKYYQAFSYVFEIDELFQNYKSIIKNLIHPAGTEIFGQYTINNNFNVIPSMSITKSTS